MKSWVNWAVAAVLVYLVLQTSGRSTQARRAPSPTSREATATTGPGGTRIAIGGSSYTNVPGVGTSISLDPALLGLNPSAPQSPPDYSRATIAAPTLSVDYIPEAMMDPPLVIVAPAADPLLA